MAELPPSLDSFHFGFETERSSFASSRDPEGLGGTRAQGMSGGSTPATSCEVDRGTLTAPEGGAGSPTSESPRGRLGGKGILGLFRPRSSSRGRKELARPVEAVPPLPSSPSSKMYPSSAPATPTTPSTPTRRGATPQRALPIVPKQSPDQFARPRDAPTMRGEEEEDLASLIHLVHAAGDKFASSPSTPSASTYRSPPTTSLSSLHSFMSTPDLSSSSTFSSVTSGSFSNEAPKVKPFVKHSVLAHLGPSTLTTEAGSGRPYTVTPIVADEGSEDEYDDTSYGKKSLWTPKPNYVYAVATIQTFSSRTAHSNVVRRRALGTRATALLDLTTARLTSLPVHAIPTCPHQTIKTSTSTPIFYPSSSNRFPLALSSTLTSLSTVLASTIVLRKLHQGVTFLEELELEGPTLSHESHRGIYRASNDSEGLTESGSLDEVMDGKKVWHQIMNSALQVFGDQIIMEEMRFGTKFPSGGVKREGMKRWIGRPGFRERGINIIPARGEGRMIIHRIRDPVGLRTEQFKYSFFIKALAGEFEQQQEWESEMRRQSLKKLEKRGKERLLGEEKRKWAGEGERLIMPGPLLLQTLAATRKDVERPLSDSESLETSDQDEIPLAQLRTQRLQIRSTPTSPRLKKTPLQEARELAIKLALEVSRLETKEILRQRKQEKLDRDRVAMGINVARERKEAEEERGRQRVLADQRRRSRAMESIKLPSGGGEEMTKEQEKRLREQRRRSRAMGITIPDPGSGEGPTFTLSRSTRSSTQYYTPLASPISGPPSPQYFPPTGGAQWGPSPPPLPFPQPHGNLYLAPRLSSSTPNLANWHQQSRQNPFLLPPSPAFFPPEYAMYAFNPSPSFLSIPPPTTRSRPIQAQQQHHQEQLPRSNSGANISTFAALKNGAPLLPGSTGGMRRTSTMPELPRATRRISAGNTLSLSNEGFGSRS